MENKPVNPKTTKDLYTETASWVFSVILFVVGIYLVILYSVAQSQTEGSACGDVDWGSKSLFFRDYYRPSGE